MEKIYRRLLKECNRAILENEVPIASVITFNNIIVASAHNKKIGLHDPTAHAEILCIRKAAKKLNSWNLSNCTLYSTLMPCNMCRSVIGESRIKKVYYFINSEKNIVDKY